MLRKRSTSHSGVSEVVGTILVLLITVIIFSSIILWVYTIPPPRASERVAIDGQLVGVYAGGSWAGATVSLTHRGGDNLFPGGTRVFLTIDNQTHILGTRGTSFDGVTIKPYGINGADETWNIGETWTYLNETLPEGARVSVMVVDLDKGLVLWDKGLLGIAGAQGPVFLDKWVDSDPNTPSRDPLNAGDAFTLYARVYDPDSDLDASSIFAYLTFGAGGGPLGYVPLMDNGDTGDKTANDGIFSRAITWTAQKNWDGGIIILNATDLAGHEAKSRLILKVGDSGGGAILPEGPERLALGSNFQRFDIFNEAEWDANKYDAQSTREFKKGEVAVVVVASKYLPNLDFSNEFHIYDATSTPVQAIVYGNAPYKDEVSTSSIPSSDAAFALLEHVAGYYVYTYKFSTNSSAYGYDGVQLAFGNYPIEIRLKASIVDPPKNRFSATDSITITDENGNAPTYPRVLFFKDALHTQPASSFRFTDTMYVVLEVRSTDGTFEIGDVVVQDFLGGIQIWAKPGSPPVSAAAINNSGLDPKRYTFSVDLTTPNMDSWLFGENSYSFLIKTFSDFDEGYGYLTRQVNVIGPLWLLDIMNALEEVNNPVGQKFYGYFYGNDRSWQKTPYETFDSTPQEQNPNWGSGPFYSIAMGDLDGDQDLDAVVGIRSGGVIVYRNELGDGSSWQRIVLDTDAGNEVMAVAAGDVDRDGDDDVVAGTGTDIHGGPGTGLLWLYKNDGYWTSTLLDSAGPFSSLKFADVDGDGDLDLVAGNNDEKVRIYFNDGKGIFGRTLVTPYYATQEATTLGNVSGGLADIQGSDDVYESLEEGVSDGVAFTEVVQDGIFTTDLSGWPTLVLTSTQGQTSWDNDSATADGSGSFRAENTLGENTKFTGYQEQVLSQPLDPDTKYTLTLKFRKSWIGLPPDAQMQGIAIRYEDGAAETVWVDPFIRNSGSWTELRVDKTTQSTHGKVLALRLAFNLDGRRGSAHQAKVWFDDVSLKAWTMEGQTSRLEHTWALENVPTGGTSYRLKMQAHHTPNLEADDFEVYYSLDDQAYIRMFTVTKTEDDDSYQAYVLPTWVGGNDIYVKVLDTSWGNGSITLDTLLVDHLVLERIVLITPNSLAIDLNDGDVFTVAVDDIDGDGDVDIAAGLHNKRVAILFNDGSGTSWSTLKIWAHHEVMNLGLADFDKDGDLDIGFGTNHEIHMLFNTNGVGTAWSLTTLEVWEHAHVLTLAVGDVNGDGWDDIVIGTDEGSVYYYRNRGPQGWDRTEIDFVMKKVFSIALGDVDRGILP